MNERVSRKISCLQFVCAIMIMALHTTFPRYFNESSQWLLSLNVFMRNVDDAAISTFFFLSAYLLFRRMEQRTYLGLLRQRLFTLVIPYVLWNALFYAHSLLREYLSMGTLLNPPTAGILLRKLTIEPANSIFWFIQTLLGFVLLFPLIRWAVRIRWPAWIAGTVAMVAVCIPQLGIPYESILYWLPVYLMGALIGHYHNKAFERVPFCGCGWIYAATGGMLCILAYIRPMGHAVHYLYWIPAPMLMWILADVFLRLKKNHWWLNTSFYLYCVHMITQHYAVKLYLLLFGKGTVSFAASNILLPCLCAALSLLGGAVVRFLLPDVFAVFTGMRMPEKKAKA